MSRPGFDLLLDVGDRGARRDSIENAVRSAIRGGTLKPGTRLPSTRDLAEQLGVARGTVSAAYTQLIAEGWLRGATGRGTWVAEAASSGAPTDVPAGCDAPSEVVRHNLRPGLPDTSMFPREAWARAMNRVVRSAPAEAFSYGDPRGRIELRAVLASYLGRVRGVQVDPDHLIICSGYTQALHLLTQVFAGIGATTAAMENPAMADHVAIVRARMRVANIPVDRYGMATDLIDESTTVTICTPAHQFPLGVSMSPQRRARLLSTAHANGMWIVEDDYDGEFCYDRDPVSALQSKAPESVVYVGSTSKSFGPAIRVGWIASPPALLAPLMEAKWLADRQTSPLDQLALAELIESGGYNRHLRASRLMYRRRRDELREAVERRLPGAALVGIAGGLHVVLLPRPGTGSEQELVDRLRSRSIRVHGLGDYLRGRRARRRPGLVIGYATPPEHGYTSAITALLDALTEDGQRPNSS